MKTMVSIFRRKRSLAIAMAAATLTTAPAQAAYVINIAEVANTVVATGSGSLNVSSLTVNGVFNCGNGIGAAAGNLVIGATGLCTIYNNGGNFLTGPTNFGTGAGNTTPDAVTGPLAGIQFNFGNSILAAPQGYVSGTEIGTSTATWNNATFASLGLALGSYVWTFGDVSNGTNDCVAINIGSSRSQTCTVSNANAVPEPTTWAMIIFGFGIAGVSLRRRAATRAVSLA